MRKTLISLALICTLFSSYFNKSSHAETVLVENLDPQFAVDWMELIYERVQADSISAPAGSRVYAYAGITLYESLLWGIPGNNSLSFQLNGLTELPYPEEGEGIEYDWLVVSSTTMKTVMNHILTKEESVAAFEAHHEEVLAQQEEISSPQMIEDSVEYGETLAEGLINWIDQDYFIESRELTYQIPEGDPSLWVVTTEGSQPAEPYWGLLRPFVLSYSDECAVPMNITYSTEPESVFYKQAMEVMQTGVDLTPEQRETAEFWVDTPGITGTPAGHWFSIGNQLVSQLDMTLDRAAMMYAMLGISLGESFISCWSLKYQVMLLRPETYIKENIRRGWNPYIQTPPFPAYPSGHSVVSAAASEVLTDFFGTVVFTDNTHRERGLAPRTYTSFTAAANEAAISRLYGGIHYRIDIENGLRQGYCIAQRIIDTIILNPVSQGGE